MKQFSRSLFLFYLFICMAEKSTAQMKRAEESFKQEDYAKSVPLYERILRKKYNTVAATHLAFCYKMLKDYTLSEYWYAKLLAEPDAEPLNYLAYGDVLRTDNKFQEAQNQFEIYLGKFPGDKEALVQIKTCQEIRTWIIRVPGFSVRKVPKLNTRFSEFSPCYYGGGLLLTSDRGSRNLIEEDNPHGGSSAIFSVYYAEFKNSKEDSDSFKSPVLFDEGLNAGYHNGPVSFSGDHKQIAFSRVDKANKLSGKHFVNHPKVYLATVENNKLRKVIPFPYNSDVYSVAQPALSEDGRTLFFTSDMPGGFGGKDLYVSHQQGDVWTQPENLGAEVNTLKDEMFPGFGDDSTLYFSSSGHPGFGGLDIFSAKKRNGKWTQVTNLGHPVNGTTDDFGIVFDKTKTGGYFTSDRMGGKGNDDIYSFRVLTKMIRVAGRLVLSQDGTHPAKDADVRIVTESGKVLNLSKTDAKGFFLFQNLPADSKYSVMLDENDPAFKGYDKVWLANEDGKIIRVTVVKNGQVNSFAFKDLPSDLNAAPELLSEDLIDLAGNILVGSNPAVPLATQRLVLKNEKGEVVQTTTTNTAGGFAFKGLRPDKGFTVAMEDNDTKLLPGLVITITNRKGKAIAQTSTDVKGGFRYGILPSSENHLSDLPLTDIELNVEMKGKLLAGDGSNSALANTAIRIVDEKGGVVQRAKTDEKGNFKFQNLPAATHYELSIGEANDPNLANLDKLLLADATGNIINELEVNKKTNAALVQLQNSELTMTLTGKLLYGPDTTQTLHHIGLVIKNSKHELVKCLRTDAQGRFRFENLPSDQNYAISIEDGNDPQLKNVSKIFLTNADGKILKELPFDKGALGNLQVDDHDLRVDLKGKIQSADSSHADLGNVTVNILNEQGRIVQTVKTDGKGNFIFENLPSDQHYMVSIELGDDPQLAKLSQIVVSDENGLVLKEIKKDTTGIFNFDILPEDQSKMGLIYLEDKGLSLQPLIATSAGSPADVKASKVSSIQGSPEKETTSEVKRRKIAMSPKNSVAAVLADKKKVNLKKNPNGTGESNDAPIQNDTKASTVHEEYLTNQRTGIDQYPVLKPIHYATSDWTVSPESALVLDKISILLKNDPSLFLNLNAYTDSRASSAFNQTLSEKRARTAKYFLVKKGIPASQIQAKGFGESVLLNKCADGVDCSDEEHAINRRTEFKLSRKQKK
jgi:outer membrane protein OmpA-like peptidoglycan-associated protein/tetratricopeptide (TPR) repeat protein